MGLIFLFRGGTTYDDVVAGTSSSSYSLVEAKAGVETRVGTSSSGSAITQTKIGFDAGTWASGSTGAPNEVGGGADGGTGTSSSTGGRSETAIFAQTRTGSASSAGALVESAIGADGRTGISSSSSARVELAIHFSTPSGVSASAISGVEEYEPPPILEVPSGLLRLLYPARPRARRPRAIYRDAPTGIAHSEHRLVERYVRGPVPPPTEPDVFYEEILELVEMGVL